MSVKNVCLKNTKNVCLKNTLKQKNMHKAYNPLISAKYRESEDL